MYKVIIIDDNKITADSLAALSIWEEYGCKVVNVCYDGSTAIETISALRPDIIMTDVKMPTVNGLELISLLRESILDTAVIYMSAYDDFSFARQALRLGAVDYLLKPFGGDELIAVIQKVVAALDKRENNSDIVTEAGDNNDDVDLQAQPIIEYISQHLEEHITAEETARAFYMSTSRLDKLINQDYGVGFREMKIKLRMNKAKELLLDVRYNVKDVASKVGYKNYASFYRAFTRKFGDSPTEYRNLATKKGVMPLEDQK